MNLFAEMEGRIHAALLELQADGILPSDLAIPGAEAETPRDPGHGDVSTNAALVLAKPARMNPREIAAKLAEKLVSAPGIAKAEVAGAGFVNLTLEPAVWHGV